MSGLIVFAVPDFEPTLGGTSRQTGNLARALQRRGYRVAVVTQRLDPAWPRFETIDGIAVHRVGPSRRGTIGMKLFVAHVAWWLRRRRRDVKAVQVLMYPDLMVSAKFAGLGHRSVMCWAGFGDASDTLNDGRPVLRDIRRWAMRRAPHIALTPSMASELERAGVKEAIVVIPTPVDLDRFRPPTSTERRQARAELGFDDDAFVVIYCGHLRALKRVELLVQGVALLLAEGIDARLLLVSEGRADLDDTTAQVEREIRRCDLGARTTMPGAVADVVVYLHAADVFVLPSEREGLSNSLLEALACGLPCIAPASAGGDQILDDSCGMVPPSNDPTDLAASMRQLAASPERRAEMAEAARVRARGCSLESVVEQYLQVYGRLDGSASAG
jgi:glycosyltransferase involved in cell wall biosynthesis